MTAVHNPFVTTVPVAAQQFPAGTQFGGYMWTCQAGSQYSERTATNVKTWNLPFGTWGFTVQAMDASNVPLPGTSQVTFTLTVEAPPVSIDIPVGPVSVS